MLDRKNYDIVRTYAGQFKWDIHDYEYSLGFSVGIPNEVSQYYVFAEKDGFLSTIEEGKRGFPNRNIESVKRSLRRVAKALIPVPVEPKKGYSDPLGILPTFNVSEGEKLNNQYKVLIDRKFQLASDAMTLDAEIVANIRAWDRLCYKAGASKWQNLDRFPQ